MGVEVTGKRVGGGGWRMGVGTLEEVMMGKEEKGAVEGRGGGGHR